MFVEQVGLRHEYDSFDEIANDFALRRILIGVFFAVRHLARDRTLIMFTTFVHFEPQIENFGLILKSGSKTKSRRN